MCLLCDHEIDWNKGYLDLKTGSCYHTCICGFNQQWGCINEKCPDSDKCPAVNCDQFRIQPCALCPHEADNDADLCFMNRVMKSPTPSPGA